MTVDHTEMCMYGLLTANLDNSPFVCRLRPDIEKLQPNSEARLMETIYAEAVKEPDT